MAQPGLPEAPGPAAEGGGRTREGPGGGGCRGGAGGGSRELGRGRERDPGGEVCRSRAERGGAQDRAGRVSAATPARSPAPGSAPSPLPLSVHRPGSPAGGHGSIHCSFQLHRIASCADAWGAAGRGRNRGWGSCAPNPEGRAAPSERLRAFRNGRGVGEKGQGQERTGCSGALGRPRERVEQGNGGAASQGP